MQIKVHFRLDFKVCKLTLDQNNLETMARKYQNKKDSIVENNSVIDLLLATE